MNAAGVLDHRWAEEEDDVEHEADVGVLLAVGADAFVVEFHEIAFDVRQQVAPAEPAEEPEGESGRRRLHENNFLNVVLIIMPGKNDAFWRKGAWFCG